MSFDATDRRFGARGFAFCCGRSVELDLRSTDVGSSWLSSESRSCQRVSRRRNGVSATATPSVEPEALLRAREPGFAASWSGAPRQIAIEREASRKWSGARFGRAQPWARRTEESPNERRGLFPTVDWADVGGVLFPRACPTVCVQAPNSREPAARLPGSRLFEMSVDIVAVYRKLVAVALIVLSGLGMLAAASAASTAGAAGDVPKGDAFYVPPKPLSKAKAGTIIRSIPIGDAPAGREPGRSCTTRARSTAETSPSPAW